ncbi:MAG TPA: hypothetical protein VFE05_00105 [Longimicrobiaceae bacterium]|jgi:hypothetical protein|nr:hypothetical protein [Longimicrobiaceae bacterium]
MPIFPVAVTALVLLGAMWPLASVWDVVALRDFPGARLVRPGAYVALAPLSDVADALLLLTVRQHVAVLLTVLAIYVIWRSVHGRPRPTALRRIGREAAGLAMLLLAVLAVYAFAVLVPRPVAALALDDREMVTVDFHTHTEASHDGRRGLTPEKVRDWHRRGGYDVAYVTDHRSLAGAAAGVARNPARAGEGTVLLSGIEVVTERLHLNVLGATLADTAYFREKNVGADSIGRFRPADGSEPVVLLTIPGNLARVRPAMSIDAVEISDAAPRGLQDTQKERAGILRLANANGWALAAASDNHGWGQTAVGWSVFRIAGWRAMPPADLDHRIRAEILTRRRGAGWVLERRRIDTGPTKLGAAAALPMSAWLMLRTLSWPERISWLAWTWVLWLSASAVRRSCRIRAEPIP